MERTFVMIKPDGIQRGLVGEIIQKYEQKGLKILALKFLMVTEEIAKKHYQEHSEKPFFSKLLKFITSSPVVVLVLEGKNAVSEVRKINGATKPLEASPGTIRGDYAQDIGRNVVHGSDSLESAQREIGIYFKEEELINYAFLPSTWLFE